MARPPPESDAMCFPIQAMSGETAGACVYFEMERVKKSLELFFPSVGASAFPGLSETKRRSTWLDPQQRQFPRLPHRRTLKSK
jgi:hypothetical protein